MITCAVCNSLKSWTYTAEMKDKHTKNTLIKDKGLPTLTKTSWDLILELAANACNKLPMEKCNNDYLCPADLIHLIQFF